MTLNSGADTAHSRQRRFAPGEHLFHQGDPDRGVHKIRSGAVTVYRVTADGYRQIETFAGPGEYVSLCLSATSPTSAMALNGVETDYTSRPAFERRLLHDPSFRTDVFRMFDQATSDARRQAAQLVRRCALERVAHFVLFLERRFPDNADGYTPILMSRSDIADHLGLTLETVSRMLNRLKHDRIIDLPRPDRFRILDRPRLQRVTGDVRDHRLVEREAV